MLKDGTIDVVLGDGINPNPLFDGREGVLSIPQARISESQFGGWSPIAGMFFTLCRRYVAGNGELRSRGFGFA